MLSKQIEKVLWFSLVVALLFSVCGYKADIFQGYHTNSVYVSSNSPKQVVLGGNAIGFEYQSDGVLVLSNGGVASFNPKNLSLQSGDIIVNMNGQKIESSSHISQILNSQDLGREVVIGFLRNGKNFEVTVVPVFDMFAKEYKLGVWVKDFISGVGTLTFFDEKTGRFGALGHSMC